MFGWLQSGADMFALQQVVSRTCWRMALSKGLRKNLRCCHYLSYEEMEVTHKVKRISTGQHWRGHWLWKQAQADIFLHPQASKAISQCTNHCWCLALPLIRHRIHDRPKKSRKKNPELFMVRKVFNVTQQCCFCLPPFVRNKTLYGMPCFFRPLTLEKSGFLIKSLPHVLWQ